VVDGVVREAGHDVVGVTTLLAAKKSRIIASRGRVMLVVLQDGRALEGELHAMSGRCEVSGAQFDSRREEP
jgi:hypothetical protein